MLGVSADLLQLKKKKIGLEKTFLGGQHFQFAQTNLVFKQKVLYPGPPSILGKPGQLTSSLTFGTQKNL